MKLIEHLEHILGLIEQKATLAEIKGSVLAMHQEAEGADGAMADKMKLVEENARLQKKIDQFVALSKLKKPSIGIPPFTSFQ